MARYVWKNGRFVHHLTGEPMYIPPRDGLCAPQVMSDIPEYISPVGDHKMITSRSERREDLKRHDCVEAPPRKHREIRNPKYRKALGLPPLE